MSPVSPRRSSVEKSKLSETAKRDGDPDLPVVRMAIPNKGRISGPVMELMEKSGLHLLDMGERRLISRTPDPHIQVLFARPADIPEYVANGVADLGITGRDLVLERESQVEELLDLQFGKARLVLAVREDSGIESIQELSGARVATEFPHISRQYFKKHDIDVTIVPVSGACEATPYLGIADAIIDLTSSGNSLRSNRLRILEEILDSSTILVCNKDAAIKKADKVEEIVLALESVIRARGQCYLMMNVRRSCLDDVRNVLPGLSGPTIMDVASKEDLVAVHAVVGEKRVYQLINLLKRAGARDILVMSIERMIR